MTLAHNGTAALPIVVSTNASEITKALAGEMAEYLTRMSGADFEIRAGTDARGIVLGTLAEFPEPDLAKALEIRNGFDGKEAYAIRTDSDRVLLLGATELGVSHAVFRFLELLGCRWFFPAKEWEIVPSQPMLRFAHNEIDRPVILSRRIAYGCGLLRDHAEADDLRQSKADYEGWCRHNRMGASLKIHASHAWQAIIARNQAEFDKHPEYYALVDGERKGPQIEVANPAVRKMVIDYALDVLRQKPETDMVSVEPSDGGGQSESEEARRLGSFSDQVFGLANEVARAVQKEFPGKMVGLLAYGWHSEPPSFDLEPNVFVERTVGFTYGRYTFDELLELWPKRCRNLGFYEYFSIWTWDFDRLPGGRVSDVSYLQEAIRRYATHNAVSITAESSNNWGPNGRGYYIASKLMWNPNADVDALLTDFYEKAFGPAAPAMRRYYERLNPGTKPLRSKNLLARAFRDVEEAGRLAGDHPDILARLDHLKQYLHYNYLYWLLDRAQSKEERKSLTLALLTHSYRMRFSYMTHWECARQLWTARAAREFEEPSWSSKDPSAHKPWKVKTSLTRREIEDNFRKGLEYFQPQTVTEKTFSSNLVPVQFAESPSIASVQSYQGNQRYAWYSIAGEPLQMEIATGLIPVYRDKPDARYSLIDANAHTIAQGRFPLDAQAHSLEIKVPGPGLYYLDFEDSAAGWRITAPADRPVSVVLEHGRKLSSLGTMQDVWFYVPRGTKQIKYFWHGRPHQVIGPDGNRLCEVTVTEEFVTVPVADGQDGKPWRLSGLRPNHLWFFNVPNLIAASPNALLVPREVATRDRLLIRDSPAEE